MWQCLQTFPTMKWLLLTSQPAEVRLCLWKLVYMWMSTFNATVSPDVPTELVGDVWIQCGKCMSVNAHVHGVWLYALVSRLYNYMIECVWEHHYNLLLLFIHVFPHALLLNLRALSLLLQDFLIMWQESLSVQSSWLWGLLPYSPSWQWPLGTTTYTKRKRWLLFIMWRKHDYVVHAWLA